MTGESQTWERWLHEWQSGVNRLNFALRNFLSWTPANYRETPTPSAFWSNLTESDLSQAQALLSRYNLASLPERAANLRVLETLTYLDWLGQMSTACPDWFTALSESSGQRNVSSKVKMRWLDVGAKNWAYVEALAGFMNQQFGPGFHLDGIELDPNRRYMSGHTRGQAAREFIKAVPQAAYHEGDIRHWEQPITIASLFLPFVFKEPHLAWGLPLDSFAPENILTHVLSLLQPGGLLLIVNQGQTEAEAQEQLLKQAQAHYGLEIQAIGPLSSSFIQYRYPRFGWVCRKISS